MIPLRVERRRSRGRTLQFYFGVIGIAIGVGFLIGAGCAQATKWSPW